MQGKIALVTGATRGIGRAVAEELVSKGAFVIGTATSEKGAEMLRIKLPLMRYWNRSNKNLATLIFW